MASMRRITVVSDLHLGDGSNADDFFTSQSEPYFDHLLREVADDPDHHLVLLGDIFEMWQFSMESILERYSRQMALLFELGRRGRVTWVIGNHDYEPLYLYVDAGIIFSMDLKESFFLPELGLYAVHGHMQDPHAYRLVPLPGREGYYQVSRRFVWHLKYLERRFPDIDERLARFGKFLMRYSRSVFEFATAFSRVERAEARRIFQEVEASLLGYVPPSISGVGPDDPWEKAAFDMMEADERIRVVLMGHTHRPRWVTQGACCYINTGSWCYANRFPCTYARADIERETVELYALRLEGGEPRAELWPSD